MIGTLVNTAAILGGTAVGLIFKKGISESVCNTVMSGLGMAVGIIGLQMALQTKNILIVILSLVIGGVLGEWMRIEDRLNNMGKWLEKKVGSNQGQVAKAFITASLIYCVGAMAIMGAIEDGLSGHANTLYVKSLLDGISAIIFSSTLGIGVAFAAIPVLIYQGSITLLASTLKVLLSDAMIREMTATGGVLIIGISLNILGIKEVKVGNLLPAIVLAVLITALVAKLNLGI